MSWSLSCVSANAGAGRLAGRIAAWLVTLPLRLFDAVATRVVPAPVDYRLSRDELRAQRDVVLEEMEKPQAAGMGGGG